MPTKNRKKASRGGKRVKLIIGTILIALAVCGQANTVVNDSFAITGEGSFPNTLLQLESGIWGTTSLGGPGFIFELLPDGEILTVYTFGDIGSEPNGGLVQTPDGSLHGVLARGHDFPDSAIFRTTSDNGIVISHQFYGDENGGTIAGDMTVGKDGRLYTVGTAGGTYNNGVVISVGPIAGDVTVLHSFDEPKDGSRPQCAPIENGADVWYGVATYGGPLGGGTFYKISGGEFNMEYAFSSGAHPVSIMLASDGNFYVGVTNGGSNGAIYRIVPDSTPDKATGTVFYQFNDGGVPVGNLLELGGYLYGMEGNIVNGALAGGLFQCDFSQNYTYIHTFQGEEPSGSLSVGLDGKILAPLQEGDIAQIQLDVGHSDNISTRMMVGTGENVAVGGFIVTGQQPKKVIVRAIGPSLSTEGVPGALADPTLDLYDSTGALVSSNDNWGDTQSADILACKLAPTNPAESAIVMDLNPGNYTAVMKGKNNTTGVGLVEVFDLNDIADSKLANISTRGLVQSGDNVMIGGTIISGTTPSDMILRAIGPSLGAAGIDNALSDPTLQLFNQNGVQVEGNDNWEEQDPEVVALIQSSGLAPTNPKEAVIMMTLNPGSFTAVVKGANGSTGVALVEAYQLE